MLTLLPKLPTTWGIDPAQIMKKSIYFENDEILQIRISDKPIVREVSQDWHTHIGYAEDGTIVEVVLLDARKEGLLPIEFRKTAWVV